MENSISLNIGWLFKPEFKESYVGAEAYDGFETVNVPHTVKTLPLNYFSHEETWLISTYVKVVDVPPEQKGKRVVLRFDGVMTYFDLFINGQKAGSHAGGYSRSMFDVTEHIRFGEPNKILLRVDSTEREDIPPFSYLLDYLTFGGVYRDVCLYYLNDTHIRNVLMKYDLEEGRRAIAYPTVYTSSVSGGSTRVKVSLACEKCGRRFEYAQDVTVPVGMGEIALEKQSIGEIDHLWDIDDPTMFTVRVSLEAGNQVLDTHSLRTGFRTVAAKPDGFYLNGRKVKLVGLNRHQSYPYVGYAMGRRAQRRDAEILKNELAVNTVRTSHYMQSEHFLERCDELGLLVFSEIPGWGTIGGDDFKRNMLRDVEAMITTSYNHPSIFIWSIRINESLDDDELYTKGNELAKRLDSSRPTTGVRYIKNSNLIEDVYGMNDFILQGNDIKLRNQHEITGLKEAVPYIVTEYCGHVYPTKPFDCEHKRENHALHHALIQHYNMLRNDAMGAIGWCAFDYNTHADYGAGDKICYHGVMDMFRIPKYAAFVYKSQKDPKDEIVLEPATILGRGERDDNHSVPFLVMTNCDYVEMTMYGSSAGKFYPDMKFAGLKHPPIIVNPADGRWQDKWQGGSIVGYIDGKEAARKDFPRDAYLSSLHIVQEDFELSSDEVEEARFICTFRDQCGNTLAYYAGILQIETTGDIEVVGPSTVSTIGGGIGFWVKSKAAGQKGEATVTVTPLNTHLSAQTFDIKLI